MTSETAGAGRDYQHLPDWLPDGTFLRNPIKAHRITPKHGLYDTQNYWLYETRHVSDGWLVRAASSHGNRPAPHWKDSSWWWAAIFEPDWIDESQ